MVALRRKVVATVDDTIDEAAADVTAVLDGRPARCTCSSNTRSGRLQRPMTDADLEAKFHGLVDPILGAARANDLIGAAWQFGERGDARSLAALARA